MTLSKFIELFNLKVKNNFYAPIMNGDYDLKKIIKVIPSDVSYKEKDNILKQD
jgi:hypothetical protein